MESMSSPPPPLVFVEGCLTCTETGRVHTHQVEYTPEPDDDLPGARERQEEDEENWQLDYPSDCDTLEEDD